jgi:hypothetical protein
LHERRRDGAYGRPSVGLNAQVISPFSHVNLAGMNKRLETLLDRVATWPQQAQDDAAMALADIEEKVRVLQSLPPAQRAKLEALRETINRSIEEGGSHTDAEVEAGIAASLDAWETERKGG